MGHLWKAITLPSLAVALLLVASAACGPIGAIAPTPTATLMPATSPPATEEGSIPTTLSQVPRIKPQKLKERLDAGEGVIVLDTMSREHYERRHVRGALSIPASEIKERHGELPKEKKIVLYSTCPAEQISARAALKLYQLGFTDVEALLGGLDAWEAAGYPVEGR